MQFTELLSRTAAVDAVDEIAVPSNEIDVKENGLFWADGQLSFDDQHQLVDLLASVGAPLHYLKEKMPSAIHAQMLNEHLRRGDFGAVTGLASKDGRLTNLFRADLLRLSNNEFLQAVMDGIGNGAASLSLAKVELSFDRLEVELVTPRKSIDVRLGDRVYGGLELRHYPLGQKPTTIQTFMQRLVCSNGMTRRECTSRDGINRTRKLRFDHPDGKQLQLNQVRRLAKSTWENIEPKLEQLGFTANRPVEVEPALEQWLRRARMSHDRLMNRLLAAWRVEGAESTEFGLVNALTRVATHDETLTPRERRMLAALGGLLAGSHAHICPRCFSVLRGSAN